MTPRRAIQHRTMPPSIRLSDSFLQKTVLMRCPANSFSQPRRWALLPWHPQGSNREGGGRIGRVARPAIRIVARGCPAMRGLRARRRLGRHPSRDVDAPYPAQPSACRWTHFAQSDHARSTFVSGPGARRHAREGTRTTSPLRRIAQQGFPIELTEFIEPIHPVAACR